MAGRGTKNSVFMTVGNAREKKSVQPGTKSYFGKSSAKGKKVAASKLRKK